MVLLVLLGPLESVQPAKTGFCFEVPLGYDASAHRGETNMTPSQPTPASQLPVGPADFPVEELRKHRGRWVAFSADGRRLIASGRTLAALEAQVRAAGANPEEVLLERIPDGEAIASGSELS
jgi:hypothetical protein